MSVPTSSDSGIARLHSEPKGQYGRKGYILPLKDEPRAKNGSREQSLRRLARKLRSAAYKVDREGDSRAAWMRVAEVAVALDEMAVTGTLGCGDCGRAYSLGPDLVVPDDVWERISPSGDEGGTLCPNCIHDRLVAQGFEYASVPAAFTSGPMANPEWKKPIREAAH